MRLLLPWLLCLTLLSFSFAQQKVGNVSFTAPKGWASSTMQGGVQFTLKNAAGEPDRVLMVGQDMPAPADPAAWLEEKARSFVQGNPLRETPLASEKLPSGLTFTYKIVVGGTAQAPVIYLVGLIHNSASAVLLAGLTGDPGKAETLGNEMEAVAKTVKFTGTPVAGNKTSSGTAGTPASAATTKLPDVNPMNAAQFKAAGGNPQDQLIPDEFRCYLKRKGDGLNADMVVQVLPGGKYRTVFGSGTYQIKKDSSLRKVTWVGGPLDKADGYMNLDHYGQKFALSDVGEDTLERSLDFECYQRGPRENVTLHHFKRLTPKTGQYPCVLADGKGGTVGRLDIDASGTYRFGGQSGRYRTDYRSDQDDRQSTITFQGGEDEETGTYSEDDTGLRQFSISVTTGGTIVSRSSTKWVCSVAAKPTPAPSRYGTQNAPAPPKGSGGLSGQFVHSRSGKLVPGLQIGPDFTSVMVLNSECDGNFCWEFAFFNPNGYVFTEEPEEDLTETDCKRTYPNGLPRCEVYRVVGNTIQIGERKPVPFTQKGSMLELDGKKYEKLLPLDNLTLNGAFESLSVRNGVYLGGSTYSTSLKFGAGRQFAFDSDSSTSIMTAGATVSSGSRDATLTGTYTFTGNTMEMRYRDGRIMRLFAVLPAGKDGKVSTSTLRIGGITYYPANKNKK